MRNGTPVLVKLPEIDLIDDKEGKPVGMQRQIGRRPIAAFGNSDGDLQMLQWAMAGPGARFALFVHHDDAAREFAYDRADKLQQFDKGWDEALAKGWTVVSMKDDWKTVYPNGVRKVTTEPRSTQMAKTGKPNILFIMADDIGWFNLSCYNHGLMGYRTPNMDRIAREGAMFTDFYGQQSCTAGRAAFLTGQQPIRTGLTKVGMPGATLGIKAEDPTIAQVLKAQGYATGQFGKNHLGDRNEHLPTVHGFDEFFGNLYHLNAEEEPEYADYPKDPNFKKKFGPRGVMKCKATDKDDPTDDPVFGKVGKQVIENTGPLTKKRMETVDEEFLASALDFMDRKTKENVPWLCYFNPTRMHVFTHLKPSSVGKTGHGLYPDGMVELDGYVGDLLKKVDDLGVTDNTIVVFTTDNGAEECSVARRRRDAVPRREGHQLGRRLARAVRDALARRDQAGRGHQRNRFADGLPADICRGRRRARHRRQTEEGPQARRHDVQGPHRRLQPAAVPVRQGEVPAPGLHLLERRRRADGAAGRSNTRWCLPSSAQRASTSGVSRWCSCASPSCSTCARIRSKPAEDSEKYTDWFIEHVPYQYGAQAVVHEWLSSFKEFPPRQKAASFSVDQIIEKLMPK